MKDNTSRFKKRYKKYNIGGEINPGEEVTGIEPSQSVFNSNINLPNFSDTFGQSLFQVNQNIDNLSENSNVEFNYNPGQSEVYDNLRQRRSTGEISQKEFERQSLLLFEPDRILNNVNPSTITPLNNVESRPDDGTIGKNNTSRREKRLMSDLEEKEASGNITEEERAELGRLRDPFYDSTSPNQEREASFKDYVNLFKGLGRGVSLETALFSLGQSAAYDGSNQDANLLRGVGSAGKLLLGGARNFLSGYGFQNRSQDTLNTYEDRIREDRRNNFEYFKDGGEVINPETNEKINPVSEEEEAILANKGFREEDENQNLSLEEILVSEKITGNKEQIGNVEVEGGEYIMYPEGEIQEVVGKDHEKGGETLGLTEGTLILSNSLKVGKGLAKQLESDFDIKVKASDSYAQAVSKFTDKVGLTKLTNDQEFLISKLKDLDKDSPSYKVNSEYIQNKLIEFEDRREALNEKRKNVFSLLYENQEQSKPKDALEDRQEDIPIFDEGGEVTKEQQDRLNNGELLYKDGKLIDAKTGVTIADNIKTPENNDAFGISLSENKFSDSEEFKRLHQNASPGGGFGKITKDNLKETMIWAHRNFPDIASRPDVFGTGYDEEGNFVYNKDIDFSKANDNVKKYQAAVNDRMNSTADTVINNPSVYGQEAVTAAEKYKKNQTFDNTLARKVDDGLWGNFSSGRFSLKTQVVTPDELKDLQSKNIFSVKDLIKATEEGIVDLSPTSLNRLQNIKGTLSEGSDFGLETYEMTSPTTDTLLDNNIVSNTDRLKRKADGDFVYLAPDQSLLPPSVLEPHLKVKNRFQRIDPVEIGVERNVQEAFRQQQFASDQLGSLPASQRAAVLSNMTANTQRSLNDAITQTNIVNAQNRQRAEQFNIGQADKENIAEGQNALNFERAQLTAKAKTDKDIRDYFAFNRDVVLNNILREQQLSSIDALSEDYSIDPFGNVRFDPTYEYKFGNLPNDQATSGLDPDYEFKILRNRKLRKDLGLGL